MSSRYSKEQLQAMAKEAIKSKTEATFYWQQLLMILNAFTGLYHQDIERKIQELADTGETA
jgi:hypothetical protein